jgi:hypothetical protein
MRTALDFWLMLKTKNEANAPRTEDAGHPPNHHKPCLLLDEVTAI